MLHVIENKVQNFILETLFAEKEQYLGIDNLCLKYTQIYINVLNEF